jgi:kynurenine 3-monooxygenase
MQPKVTIIGAGMSGCLMAIYLARENFQVEIYERRGDMRKETVKQGRSINMTLARRGIQPLEEVGLLDKVMKITLPLKGRIVHTPGGRVVFQPYGKNDHEVIHSVMRNDLNMVLMNEAERYPSVRFNFLQRCVRVDKTNTIVHIQDEQTGELRSIQSEFIIGADGVFSNVRQQMQRGERAIYQQDFLGHGYKELRIPPGPNGRYLLPTGGLHIWPRGDHMLIAMPNSDGSFTCTCILPFEGPCSFDSLQTEEAVMEYFNIYFRELIPYIPRLAENFINNAVVGMITTHIFPWHYKDSVVLMGDACHAIVPFYGLGMNIAFEDCSVLNECLKRHVGDREAAFREYQNLRKCNTDALAHLSKQNFIELREKVRSPMFIAQKRVDVLLNKLFPRRWQPLYTLICHSTLPIAEALKLYNKRQRIARLLGLDVLKVLMAAGVLVQNVVTERRERRRDLFQPESLPVHAVALPQIEGPPSEIFLEDPVATKATAA